MGEVGEETPKWLLEVGERSIAQRQLEGLEAATDAVASIRVLTGHAHEAIERFIDPASGIETVHNPHYERLNNWYSVLVALRSIDDPDPAVAVINGDLLAPAEWFAHFARDAANAEHQALIAVDLARELTDESMKVSVAAGDERRLEAIGKTGIDNPVGEYVGMLAARGQMLAEFRSAFESFEGRPESANEWYERGVGLNARAGLTWTVWPTPGGDWMEIDDDNDHAAAVALQAGGSI